MASRNGSASKSRFPTRCSEHQHIDGLGEDKAVPVQATTFYRFGIGDIFVSLKYNVLPTLRVCSSPGFGVYLPTGENKAADPQAAGSLNRRPSSDEGRSASRDHCIRPMNSFPIG